MFTKYRGSLYEELWDNAVKLVTQRAQRLLKLSGMIAPPFLPERLAPFQGIKRIIPEDLGELSGLLLPLRDGFEIKINATHSPERQNFSCAHEIGHTFFLQKDGQVLRERLKRGVGEKVAKRWEEDLCDIIASELLMPSHIYTKYAASYNFRINSLITLSRTFNISIVPAALRLCDVNPRWCFLVHWIKENSDDISSIRLRASWLTWSRKKTTTKTGRFIKTKLLDKNYGILKAYNSDSSVYLHEWMGIGNFRGNCQIWSQGVGTEPFRFVISLIFPEYDG